jgi:hypothetical protein
LSQFAPIIEESQGYSSDNKAVAIELELHADLYRCVVQQALHIGSTKARFHAWKVKHTDRQYTAISELSLISIELQRDATLMLGYTSAMLILERWELAQIPAETLARSDEESSSSASDADVLTQSIITCALAVLSDVGNMSSTFGTLPTFDILLCAYAGVTLVQFADSLSDIRGVSELMLRVDQQRSSPGCRRS